MAVAEIKLATKSILTYEDYLELPHIEGGYEIIDGELKLMPGASWSHQDIVMRLVVLFIAFQRASRSGRAMTAPFDVLIQRFPIKTRQPDVFFITNERLDEVGGIPQEGALELGPELVVEVLSPSETRRTVMEKMEDYRRVGVREAWLISGISETIEVLQLSETNIQTVAAYTSGQTCVSVTIPGLSVSLADVFDE